MSDPPGLFCRSLTPLLLCLLIRLSYPSFLRAQPIRLPDPEPITARQGLPQAFVPAITQDKRGFIWMATRDGLARYDGYTFRVFQPSADSRPSLSSPGLTNLTLAPDGYLWIQNDQFGLDGFDPRHETVMNLSRQPDYRERFGTDTLMSLYPDAHQRIWLIFRRQGLARYDLNTRQFVQFAHQLDQPHAIASKAVNAVTEDGRGQLWVATDRGLDRFDPTTNQFIHLGYPGGAPGNPAEPIRRLYRRPAGDLWLCTDRHLIRWNPRTGQTQRYALPRPNEQAGWPNQIAFDSQGNDYISTGRQLFRYSPAQGLQPLTTPGASVQYVSLFVDQSDVLWAGTDLAGVQKFNLRTAAFQNRPYQRSFVADWLTDYAGVPTTRFPAALAGTNAYNFRSTIDAQGKLWFAVGGTPLYRLDPATHQLTTEPGPATLHDYKLERPTLLSTDPDGRIWVVPSRLEWLLRGQSAALDSLSPPLPARHSLGHATGRRGPAGPLDCHGQYGPVPG